MMERDAVLFVDDVHIYACAQLMLLLREQPEFEQASLVGNGEVPEADERSVPCPTGAASRSS
jgi:hypothetical protein